MASKYTHDVVATNGEYKTGGETKKRYVNIGKGFTDDQGRISIKLDSIPVGPEWSGWISLYPAKERDGQQQPQRAANQDRMPPGRQQQRTMPPKPEQAEQYDDDDAESIPF